MTRDRSDDINRAWDLVRDMRRRALLLPDVALYQVEAAHAAREYLRLSGSVGEAACYAALGGIEAEIARLTCEELVR